MRKLIVTEDPFFMDGPIKRFKDDQYTEEDDQKAQGYIDLGWVKCAETGECGERKPGAQSLTVDSVKKSST